MILFIGDILDGEFQCSRNIKQVRSFIIAITLNNKTFTYNLS